MFAAGGARGATERPQNGGCYDRKPPRVATLPAPADKHCGHPQMREVACILLNKLKAKIPVVFDDIGGEEIIKGVTGNE